MKTEDTKRSKLNKRYSYLLIGAAVLIILYFFIDMNLHTKLINVLQPIVIGIIFAYLLNPLMKLLEKNFVRLFNKIKKEKTRRNLSRGISVGISVIALLAVFVAIISLLVPQLLKSISKLIADLPGMVSGATEFYNELVVKYDLPNRLNEFSTWYTQTIGGSASDFELGNILTTLFSGIQSGIIKSIGTLGNGVVSVFSTLVDVVIGLVVTVYLLACKERMFAHFKKVMYAFFDRNKINTVIKNSKECNNIVTNYIVSKIVASVIVGILCFALMMIFNIQREHAVLISVIIGVTDIIPFFGPYIGAIPSTLIILLSDPLDAVYFVIMILVIQQLEGNIISPKIIGDSIGVSPFWVLFATIVGGGMFGIVGMLLGVPVLAIIFFIIRLISNKKLQEKNMSILTESYIPEGIYNAEVQTQQTDNNT